MMRSRFGFAFAVLTSLGLLTFGSAVVRAGQPVVIEVPVVPGLIENHNFEDPPLAENNFTSTFCNPGDPICVQTPTPVVGWEVLGSAGTWNPTATAYPGGLPGGGNTNVAYANSGSDAFISQILEAVLEPEVSYSLQVAIGRRTDDQFPGYKVQLWAGETLLAEDDNTLTPAPGTFATSRIVANIGATHPALGENLEIVLISQGRQTNFDDVRLTTKPFAPPISNIRFYVKLDGDVEKVIVRNGALELRARCSIDSETRIRLFFTSTQPGWFGSVNPGSSFVTSSLGSGPFEAGLIKSVSSTSDDQPLFATSSPQNTPGNEGIIVAAPDGASIALVRESTGIGVNMFGHDCVAIGTAVLINDSN